MAVQQATMCWWLIPLLTVSAALLPLGTSKRLPSVELLSQEDQLEIQITALDTRLAALYDAYEILARPNTTTTVTTTTTRDMAIANARLKAFVESEVRPERKESGRKGVKLRVDACPRPKTGQHASELFCTVQPKDLFTRLLIGMCLALSLHTYLYSRPLNILLLENFNTKNPMPFKKNNENNQT